jgi:hypothetical protein
LKKRWDFSSFFNEFSEFFDKLKTNFEEVKIVGKTLDNRFIGSLFSKSLLHILIMKPFLFFHKISETLNRSALKNIRWKNLYFLKQALVFIALIQFSQSIELDDVNQWINLNNWAQNLARIDHLENQKIFWVFHFFMT